MFTQALSNSIYRKEPQSTEGDEQNGQKAVIVVSVVEENAEKPNEEIEKEITEELSRESARIPWMKKV